MKKTICVQTVFIPEGELLDIVGKVNRSTQFGGFGTEIRIANNRTSRTEKKEPARFRTVSSPPYRRYSCAQVFHNIKAPTE